MKRSTTGWLAWVVTACLAGTVGAHAVRGVEPAHVTAALEQARQWRPGQDYAAFRTLEDLARETRPGEKAREALEDGLLALVRSDASYEARRRACRLLWVVGSDRSVGPLLELTTDPEQVELACHALRSHPGRAVDAGLIERLPALKGNSLLAVVNLLGDRRAAAAVPALATLAGSGEPAVAEAALSALGRIGSVEAGRRLWRLWNASGPERSAALRNACLQCAQRLEGVQPRLARRFYEAFWRDPADRRSRLVGFLGLVRLGGPQAMSLVSEAMADPDERLARAAIAATAGLPGDGVSTVFLRRLPDLPAERQAALLRALARREEPEPVEAARRWVREAEPGPLRTAAVELLGEKGDARDVPVLAGLLEGSDREAALAALRRIPGLAVRAALLEVAARGEPLDDEGFLELLAERQVNGAAVLLVNRLRERPGAHAAALLKALGALADPALVPAILDAAPAEAVEPAIEAALRIWRRAGRTDEAVPWVWERYATETNPAWRRGLLQAAATLGGAAGWQPVAAALHDADEGVRAAAVRALAGWPSPEVLPVLLSVAAGADEKAAVIALRGTLRLLEEAAGMNPADRLAAWRRALELARRPEERRLALAGLGGSGLAGAVELITPWLEEADLRAEAVHALLQLAAKLPSDRTEALRRALEGVEIKDANLRKQVEETLRRLRQAGAGSDAR